MKLKIFKNKLILYLFIMLSINNVIKSQTFNKPGVTSAQFLKIGISARAEAMGQAVSAFINDGSASFYNPSGLMNVEDNDLFVGYTFMPANVGLSFINYTKKLSDNNAVAISMISLRSDEMKIRTVLQPEGTGQTFHVADYAFGIHYAHNFTFDLKVGFSFRYLNMNLVSGLFSKNSWSADMGIQYDTGLEGMLEGLKIGMMVANFGPEVKFINESYGLPLKYVIGLSKPIKLLEDHSLITAFNWIKAIDEKQKVQLGLEYNFSNTIFLRSGYKFASDIESWSTGLGISQKISGLSMEFDYSYGDYSVLGSLHRISTSLKF